MSPVDYSDVIYDANCIIYHCFEAKEKTKRRWVVFKYPILTDRIHSLTNTFVRDKIIVQTIKIVWEEIFRKGVAQIVQEFCQEPHVKNLFYRAIGKTKVPPAIKLKLQTKLERKVRELPDKPWFKLAEFVPTDAEIDAIKAFYVSLADTPKMVKHMRTKGLLLPYPSYADMSLLVYSSKIKAPVVTNDSDLVDFKSEIENKKICFRIIPL